MPSEKHEELLASAIALKEKLAARTSQADALRRIPDETIADFRAAGFFKMLQPSRWGGLEVDPGTFFDVQMAVASACPSSAWVLGVVAVHAWQLALFPLQAQEDVWGKDAGTLVSSSYAPTGKIVRAEGGYRVSGRWSFSSGCDHCYWVFLGGFVPPEAEGKPPEMRTFLLPRTDYRIDDNWHVAGLKGTGSKDIVVENAFVPEHRTHKLIDGFKRVSPGNEANPAPLYKLPFGQIFVRSVSTSAIGAAEGALSAFLGIAAKRVAAGDGAKVAEDPTTQTVAARASMLADEARVVLHRNFDEMMGLVRAGKDIPVDRRVRFRHDSAMAVVKSVEAVDLLFTASGGRAIFLDSPLLRYFLDVHAARAHYANNPDKPGRNFGGVLLGAKTVDYFI
ncbi:MAG TPA: flavin-dependent monooxygenase [Polyangiaceae bacterium]|jgi:3-hydroxy-9,10-secoandrosta-1,3,5(10)-triene-9,17-dione monooxygenase